MKKAIAVFCLLAGFSFAQQYDDRNLPVGETVLINNSGSQGGGSGTAGTHVFPSLSSTVVGSLPGGVNACEAGYFWSVGRGDSVTETFADSASITSYKLDVDVVQNVLNSGAFVNWNVLINNVVVDNFTVNEGFIGTVSRSASFAAIAGPNYTVKLAVTNEVAGGQGSHTFRRDCAGAHSVQLGGGCTGAEAIKKAKCKKGKLKVVTAGGVPGDSVTASSPCGSGSATVNGSGKAKIKISPCSTSGTVGVKWGCGASASKGYTCS